MTRRTGIIGHPVAHSLSPVFQEAAFVASGLDARYEAWDTPSAGLPARVETLRGPDYLGANVTIPYKEVVVPLLDELEDRCRRVGAVNTVVNREGRLLGFNTDGPGFVAALRSEAEFEPGGRSFLLLGAGGSARGIAFALADARAGTVAIANRTHERALGLASDLRGTAPRVRIAVVAGQPDPSGFDCVVNCTPAGMEGGGAEAALACDLAPARPGTLVVDIVYAPAVTPLIAAARAAGLPTLGGLAMLIYQGALAFELWTGVSAPVQAMFEAARAALAAGERAGGPAR